MRHSPRAQGRFRHQSDECAVRERPPPCSRTALEQGRLAAYLKVMVTHTS
jgi:hypothetical protein